MQPGEYRERGAEQRLAVQAILSPVESLVVLEQIAGCPLIPGHRLRRDLWFLRRLRQRMTGCRTRHLHLRVWVLRPSAGP